MGFLNENLESLNLNNNFYWFQQNSKNIYRMCLGETDWLLTENKDNYVAKEMFRVCMIGPEEAIITGRINKYINILLLLTRRYEWLCMLELNDSF